MKHLKDTFLPHYLHWKRNIAMLDLVKIGRDNVNQHSQKI